MRKISLNNGYTFISCVDAIKIVENEENPIDWDVVAHYMDDEAREITANKMAPCTNLEFLKGYLNVAPCDLIVG